MLCPWESRSEATCWDAPAKPITLEFFHHSLLSFPLPSAHPFIFSILSPPSALFPFSLSPIFGFALLSVFPFLLLSLFFFPFFPLPLRIVSWFFFLPGTFFSPYIILLVLSGSHWYFLTLYHRRAHIPKAHQNSVWKTTTGEKKGEKESEVFMWLNQLFHGWLAFGSKELWL